VSFSISKEQWQFINSFADWASAIGTMSAVVLSLHLSRQSSKPKVRVSADVMFLYSDVPGQFGTEHVGFSVVNIGDRPVRITGIGLEFGWFRWKYSLFKKRNVMIFFAPSSFNSTMPVDLQHGQDAKWMVMSDESQSWYDEISGRLGRCWRFMIWTLRVQAYSSVGPVFKAKPSKDVIMKLKDACGRQYCNGTG
jgi:hypothetical protein